jgi:hypothetical protein
MREVFYTTPMKLKHVTNKILNPWLSSAVALAMIGLLVGACSPAAPAATQQGTARPTQTPGPTRQENTISPLQTDVSRPETVSAESGTGLDSAPLSGQPGMVPMSSPDYGMQVFLFWRNEVADRDLKLVQDAGFRWVKQEFAWREIEGAGKGIYDWTATDRLMQQVDDHGLNIIARVGAQPEWVGGGYPEIGPPDDYQDFADFLTVLATRYKGRIDAYQIWNEPNLSREWGESAPDPAEYTRLLKVAYQAVKAADPGAYVISAGLAPTTRWDDVAIPDTVFVQGMYDAGAAPYFDLLGVHGAGYKVSPQTSPEEVAGNPEYNHNDPSPAELRRIYCFRHVEDLRAIMVENRDEDKRVALLEFGWTTDPRPESPYHWHAVSEQQQADFLVAAYRYAQENWQPWIAVMSLIYMPDVQWGLEDEQTYWSIIYPGYPELRMRAAYWNLQEMEKRD